MIIITATTAKIIIGTAVARRKRPGKSMIMITGIPKASDRIAVPATEGTHIIEVIAIDNDNQWDGDPQEITISQWVIIDPPPITDPPPISPIIG